MFLLVVVVHETRVVSDALGHIAGLGVAKLTFVDAASDEGLATMTLRGGSSNGHRSFWLQFFQSS